MELKKRIKALRLEKGLSRDCIAQMFGKTEGAVRTWENGVAKPTLEDLITLSNFFECSTDYLLGISDCRNPEQKVEIEGLYAELENAMSEIWNRDKYLNDLVKFLKVAPQEHRQAITDNLFATISKTSLLLRNIYEESNKLDKGESVNLGEWYAYAEKQSEHAKYNFASMFTTPITSMALKMLDSTDLSTVYAEIVASKYSSAKNDELICDLFENLEKLKSDKK